MLRSRLLLRSLAAPLFAGLMLACTTVSAVELPWWVDSVTITPPGTGGVGAVKLEGVWWDTAAPDAISHSLIDGALHLSLSAPGLAGAGDALTPWTLTEEFGPLDSWVNEITGSVWNVHPEDRGLRELVSGPDLLGWIYPPPRGEFYGLGSLGGGAYLSRAMDVSADGRVVTGQNELAPYADGFIVSQAFAWSPSTGMVNIDLLPGGSPGGATGRGVSADGNYIVGDSTIRRDSLQSQEAFRWSLGGGVEPLGTIHGASSTSEARAVSRGGRVVVGVDEFFAPGAPGIRNRHAFRYNDETGLQDLGTLPEYGEYSTSEAVDVTAAGELILGNARRGESVTADAIYQPDLAQPFLWTRGAGMQGLGNPARPVIAIYPPPQQETIANAISADGKMVVGVDKVNWPPYVDGITPYQTEQAVLWTEEQGWQDLAPFRLPPGPVFMASEAVDVSTEQRRVVGHAYVVATDATDLVNPLLLEGELDAYGRLQVPFLWDREHGMRPLARVLAGDYGLDFEGWTLSEVGAISDDGTTIVGTGANPDGEQEAWRAVLHRDYRPGDADFDGDVDRRDYEVLATNLGMTSDESEVYWMYGDFDDDGQVGETDMALFMANYDGRSQGDFNGDGVVNSADYTVWRDHQADVSGIADSDGDYQVTAADYQTWKQNFGLVLTDLSEAIDAQPIPEPAALWLTALAITALPSYRSRGWHTRLPRR